MRVVEPSKKIQTFLVVSVFFFSGLLFVLFYRYGVDVPTWDMWDFLQPVFGGATLWEIFHTRYAMVRPGLGEVLTVLLYRITDWNIRAEMFMIIFWVFANTLLALALKKRLLGGWHWSDFAIILIFLNFGQYETILFPTSSHSIFPLTLGLLLAHALLFKSAWLKALLSLGLGFLLLFTGFGMFLFFGMVVYYLASLLQSMRARRGFLEMAPDLTVLVVSLGYLCFFFCGYKPETGTPQAFGTITSFKNYAFFLLMLPGTILRLPTKGAYPSMFQWVNLTWGLVFLVFAGGVLWGWLRQGAKNLINSRTPREPLTWIGLFFLASSGLYVFFTLIGRAPSGWQYGGANRYFTLQAPLFFFLYLLLRSQNRKVLLVVFLSIFLTSMMLNGTAAVIKMRSENTKRNGWVQVMRAGGSLELAEEKYPSAVYPGGGVGVPSVTRGVQFLKERKLSLFRPMP